MDNYEYESETIYIRDEISKCEDVEELKMKIFPLLKSQQENWVVKINEIISSNGYSKSKFAELCGVSRVTVDKWCKGAIPKNREMFLRIGMVAGYDVSKMNQLLMRYGRYPSLYPKSLEDCICIFVISKNYGKETIEKYDYVLNKIKDNFGGKGGSAVTDIETYLFNEKILEVNNEDELEAFIMENIEIFTYAYYKFYAYVKVCISSNYGQFGGSVYELAEGQSWSSSLRQCVSAIRQNKWYPTRNKIISLGIHLSMDHDQIDEMLELAHMEPLCAKNIFESVIMFILDDASLQDMLNAESDSFDPDDLCRYAREILGQLDFPEIENFILELPEMDVDDEW